MFHALIIRSRYLVLFLISFLIVAWYSLAFPCGGNLFLFRRYLRLLLCFSLVYLPLKGFGACACCLFSFRWLVSLFSVLRFAVSWACTPCRFLTRSKRFFMSVELAGCRPGFDIQTTHKGEGNGGGGVCFGSVSSGAVLVFRCLGPACCLGPVWKPPPHRVRGSFAPVPFGLACSAVRFLFAVFAWLDYNISLRNGFCNMAN